MTTEESLTKVVIHRSLHQFQELAELVDWLRSELRLKGDPIYGEIIALRDGDDFGYYRDTRHTTFYFLDPAVAVIVKLRFGGHG